MILVFSSVCVVNSLSGVYVKPKAKAHWLCIMKYFWIHQEPYRHSSMQGADHISLVFQTLCSSLKVLAVKRYVPAALPLTCLRVTVKLGWMFFFFIMTRAPRFSIEECTMTVSGYAEFKGTSRQLVAQTLFLSCLLYFVSSPLIWKGTAASGTTVSQSREMGITVIWFSQNLMIGFRKKGIKDDLKKKKTYFPKNALTLVLRNQSASFYCDESKRRLQEAALINHQRRLRRGSSDLQ